MPTEHLDEIAVEILDAASRRFLHYGYGKTTMSEIAKDCNMSTGNLYRYFSSKLDIAEMFVRVLRREQMTELRAVAAKANHTPSETLREFFMLKFKISYERFHDNPKAFELSSELLSQRPKVALEWSGAEAGVLSDILRRGIDDGSFAVEDITLTAKILQDTAYRFTSPSVFHEGEFDELAVELDGVIDLVLDGFAYRAEKKQQNSAKLATASFE